MGTISIRVEDAFLVEVTSMAREMHLTRCACVSWL